MTSTKAIASPRPKHIAIFSAALCRRINLSSYANSVSRGPCTTDGVLCDMCARGSLGTTATKPRTLIPTTLTPQKRKVSPDTELCPSPSKIPRISKIYTPQRPPGSISKMPPPAIPLCITPTQSRRPTSPRLADTPTQTHSNHKPKSRSRYRLRSLTLDAPSCTPTRARTSYPVNRVLLALKRRIEESWSIIQPFLDFLYDAHLCPSYMLFNSEQQ